MGKTECCLCNMTGVYMYLKVPGTNKFACLPCIDTLIEARKKYIGDVIHKAHKNYIHEHRKIESPDEPSDKQI